MSVLDNVARPPLLVVGAGITGAALAWVAARHGHAVTLISVDRPASQATALDTGIVHGLGPPGAPQAWTGLGAAALRAAAARARRGYDLLRDALLASDRTCGLLPLRHVVSPPPDADAGWAARLAAEFRASGFPLRVETTAHGELLVRDQDAVLSTHRLTFELLAQARRAGATVRLRCAYGGVRDHRPGGVTVAIGDEVGVFARVLWAAGRVCPDDIEPPPCTPRIVLHQLFSPGREPLGEILRAGAGDMILSPDPLREGHTVLVRMAEELPSGGLLWPDAPPDWQRYMGQAQRQRLDEVLVGPADRRFDRPGAIVCMCGFAQWPVTAVLGACCEALEA